MRTNFLYRPTWVGRGEANCSVRMLIDHVSGRRNWACSHRAKSQVGADRALPGRTEPTETTARHLVRGTPVTPPFPDGMEQPYSGWAAFWGAERMFWSLPGVYTSAVGYAGGMTPNPTYREVCSGRTGHTEAVLVAFDPAVTSYESLLGVFFEGHNPTKGMRQGNDMGTQYRSAIHTTSPEQASTAAAVAARFRESLNEARLGAITTGIAPGGSFYFAEPDHQQSLEAHPGGTAGWVEPECDYLAPDARSGQRTNFAR